MTVGRSVGCSTESCFVVVGTLGARAGSCRGNQHTGQDHHQVAVEKVCLVGLALCSHSSRGEERDSLQVGHGPADANQEQLGDAQLQYNESPDVTVVR